MVVTKITDNAMSTVLSVMHWGYMSTFHAKQKCRWWSQRWPTMSFHCLCAGSFLPQVHEVGGTEAGYQHVHSPDQPGHWLDERLLAHQQRTGKGGYRQPAGKTKRVDRIGWRSVDLCVTLNQLSWLSLCSVGSGELLQLVIMFKGKPFLSKNCRWGSPGDKKEQIWC